MDKKRELAKNTVIIFVGKICTQFLSFFLLPLYTTVLLAKDYGLVDLLTTVVSLLVPIITLQLENAVFRFLIDKRHSETGKKEIISSVFKCVLVELLLSIILYLILIRFSHIPYVDYLFYNIIAAIFSTLLLQITRGIGDNKGYAIGSFVSAASLILSNVIFLLLLRWGAIGMLISSVISNVLCSLYLFFRNKLYRYIGLKSGSKKTIWELLSYSIPLIPNSISWWVINVSDRLIITAFMSVAANGIYAVSNKFSGLFVNLYNIFSLSWVESASLHLDDEDRDSFFSETIQTMFILFSSLCLGMIAFLPLVFPFFVNVQYKEAYLYIPILLLSNLCNVVVGLFSVVYVAKKMSKEISKTSIISAIINIVVNIILIKKLGLYAASLSTLIAFLTMAIYRAVDVQKYVKVHFDYKKLLGIGLVFVGVICLYYQDNGFLHIMSAIFVTIYTIIINRSLLKGGLHMIQNFTKKNR